MSSTTLNEPGWFVLLVRKISRAKWDGKSGALQGLEEGEISADAVTADLRIHGNALSFWQCNIDENSKIEDAVLAIASAGDHLDKIDVVWLMDSELRKDGLALKSSDGRTPVKDLVRKHVDVCKLDYVRLGKIVKRMHFAVQNNQCRRFTKLQAKMLLKSAVLEGRIELAKLSERIRNEIGVG